MQRLFRAATHTYYHCRCLVYLRHPCLRGLREPRVPPEPLAVLEEQDCCEIMISTSDPRYWDNVFLQERTERRHCERDESQ